MLTKTTKVLMAVSAGLLLVTTGAVGYVLTHQEQPITVEDLVGKTREEAIAWQEEAGVSLEQMSFRYSYDEEIEKDTVLSQSIDAGEVLGKTDVLEVVLSDGKDPDLEVEVIDFKDQKLEAIQEWFEENAFTNVSYAFQSDEEIEENLFLSMMPKAGKLKRSAKITVTVSSGNSTEETKEVTVPDFATYTKTNMQAWGTTNKVTLSFTTQTSTTVSAGKLISQSVKAGTKVKTGSTIRIVLSAGKGITVVSYVGKARAELQTWATSNGMKVSFSEAYSDQEVGILLSQNPSSGSATEGGTITAVVSAGQVPIKNCVGSSQATFENYLKGVNGEKNSSAKISFSVVQQESDRTAGTILEQKINGAQQGDVQYCSPGTKITITVAVGKQVTVSNKAGSSEADFKTYLSGLGMGVGSRSERYHDSIGAGAIISNDTGTMPVGSSVNYVVSKGAYNLNASLYAPGASYSTLSSSVSSANAAGAGYTISSSNEGSQTYSAGQIIACSVSGKSIQCQVSSGIVISVPNVVGMSVDQAKSALSKFKVTVSSVGYNDAAANTVLGQSLSAGSSVAEGSAITITYSEGPKPVVKGLLPPISYALYTGMDYDYIVSSIQGIYQNAGFTNLTFRKLTGENNPNNYKGVNSVSPNGDGTTQAELSTPIVIEIFAVN